MLLDTLNNLELIDILVIIAHLSVILTFWAIGYLLLRKSKDKNEITKNYLIGISLFMILYGISRLLMFLFELQVDPFIWHLQPSETNQLLANNPDLSRKYDLYWYSGTAISALSMAIMLFELERHILKKKTKYGLSIFQVVTITLGLILGASSAEEVSFGKYMLYISSIPALFVPIIYLYYGFKTTGDSRKRAFKSAAGFIIFFLGSMVNSTLGKTISLNLFGEYGVIINYLLYGILSSVGIVIYHKSLVF